MSNEPLSFQDQDSESLKADLAAKNEEGKNLLIEINNSKNLLISLENNKDDLELKIAELKLDTSTDQGLAIQKLELQLKQNSKKRERKENEHGRLLSEQKVNRIDQNYLQSAVHDQIQAEQKEEKNEEPMPNWVKGLIAAVGLVLLAMLPLVGIMMLAAATVAGYGLYRYNKTINKNEASKKMMAGKPQKWQEYMKQRNKALGLAAQPQVETKQNLSPDVETFLSNESHVEKDKSNDLDVNSEKSERLLSEEEKRLSTSIDGLENKKNTPEKDVIPESEESSLLPSKEREESLELVDQEESLMPDDSEQIKEDYTNYLSKKNPLEDSMTQETAIKPTDSDNKREIDEETRPDLHLEILDENELEENQTNIEDESLRSSSEKSKKGASPEPGQTFEKVKKKTSIYDRLKDVLSEKGGYQSLSGSPDTARAKAAAATAASKRGDVSTASHYQKGAEIEMSVLYGSKKVESGPKKVPSLAGLMSPSNGTNAIKKAKLYKAKMEEAAKNVGAKIRTQGASPKSYSKLK